MPGAKDSRAKHPQTPKLMTRASRETFMAALPPHRLQITSMHRNIIQLNTVPQSTATYL